MHGKNLLKQQKSVSLNVSPPSSLNYTIKIASQNEKNQIIKVMIEKQRQTMNLSIMPTAKLFLILDKENNDKTVGWAGVDFEYNRDFPELFSLFIESEYRGHHLSLILTHVRSYLLFLNGISKAYIRMEASCNQDLIKYNIQTGFYRILQGDEINENWRENCYQCELYQRECRLQAYLEVDVLKIKKHCDSLLGILTDAIFPKSIILRRDELVFAPKWE